MTDKIKKQEAINQNTVLYGPPGCGKTSYVENVTKAIATQLGKNVIFYNIKNAELKTKTKNSAISHIDQLFEQVYEKAEGGLVVLFFDELDGISTKRESIDKEKEDKIDHQNNDITALLLQKIEEAAGKENILIFGATNHIENMDDALIRNGRFHARIHIGKPNIEMRKNIIENLFNKATGEELSLLLHLTSNQTSVEVADTVEKYLDYKKMSEKKIKEGNEEIKSFVLETLIAQNKRNIKEEINKESIEAWIEKSISEESINNLKNREAKNKKIVSLESIKNQKKFPSLKCNIEGLISAEKINKSHQEKELELKEKFFQKQNELSENLLKLIEKTNNQSSIYKEILKEGFSSISTELKKFIPNNFEKEDKLLDKLNNHFGSINDKFEKLTTQKQEEIAAISGIKTSLEDIVNRKKMSEYLDQTAKTILAINFQSHSELSFESRKGLIVSYFNRLEEEFKEEEKIAKDTLLYLLLLLTEYLSSTEIILILEDLCVNKTITPNKEIMNAAIKELNLRDNKNCQMIERIVSQETNSHESLISERQIYEKNKKSKLTAFSQILNIVEENAYRIFLRNTLFITNRTKPSKNQNKVYSFFMEKCINKIKDLVSNVKNDNYSELDKQIKEYTKNFTYKANTPDDRNKIRVNSLAQSSPNSYIKFDTFDDIKNILNTIEAQNEEIDFNDEQNEEIDFNDEQNEEIVFNSDDDM